METLATHCIVLRGRGVVLRPLTERDWPLLLRWNRNPDVLRWAEAPDNPAYDLAQVQHVYRAISRTALCFVIKAIGRAVGECWIQHENLERIIGAHAGLDCRRIDISIGEPQFWGRGIGSEAIRLLVHLGFERERCDLIFAHIDAANERSLGAFRRAGFELKSIFETDTERTCDLALERTAFLSRVAQP